MRIIGGKFGGQPIRSPSGQATRPTTDRTRESLFNILAHRPDLELQGARVLDLYAGSGALGLEALSRGAAFCLFVDTDASARGAIRGNIEALGLFGSTRIHRRPADALGAKPAGVGPGFTLCFIDPPYRKGKVEPTLRTLIEGRWLDPGAVVVVEQSSDESLVVPDGMSCDDERRFGDTRVTFLSVPTA